MRYYLVTPKRSVHASRRIVSTVVTSIHIRVNWSTDQDEQILAGARFGEPDAGLRRLDRGGVEIAGRQLLTCAVRAGFGTCSRVHAVGDGAPWIVGQIEERFGDQGRYLIDFYHVCEYLSAVAAGIAIGADAREAWIETQKEALKAGRLDATLQALA